MKKSTKSALSLDRATMANITPSVSSADSRMPTLSYNSWSVSNCCE